MLIPKFSFIVPVYNAQAYLKRCLDSLLQQDVKEIQIITVDDGSTDISGEILKDYESKYPDIVQVISQNNCGIGPARNVGFAFAKGEFIWFVDNDDWIKPNCLGQLYDCLTRYQCEILNINFVHTSKMLNFDQLNDTCSIHEETIKEALLFEIECPWSKIFNREFLVTNKLYFLNIYGEDTAEIFRLIASAKSIYHTDTVYYAWYYREGSFSNKVYTPFHFMTFSVLIKTLLQQAAQFPEYKGEFEYIIYARAKMIIDAFRNTSVQEAADAVKFGELVLSQLEGNIYLIIKNRHDKDLEKLHSSYKNSFSWRVTEPFRKLSKFVKGNF